jgi:hypothetical protein
MITMFRKVATDRKITSRRLAVALVRSALAPCRISRLDSHIPIGIRAKPRAKAIGRTTKDRIPM